MTQSGLLTPTLLLVGLWWLLTGGSADSWLIGVPTIAFAIWAAHRLGVRAVKRVSLRGVVAFLPFFIWESVRGGVDVARRVLAPAPRLAPGFQDYVMRLSHPQAQLLFVNTVSLLPGTLAAQWQGATVRIHALDVHTDFHNELTRLENAVAAFYADEA